MTTQSVAPSNFEQKLTFSLILILGAISTLTPLAIDMYLPAMPNIAIDLLAPPGLVQQTLAAYTAGFAIGQLIHGPISDSYGRRPVLLIGVFCFFIGTLFCAIADSINSLIYIRALQGFCGAATAVVIQALVRDMFAKEEFARTMSFITLVMTIAPLAAPMIGGYLTVWFGWRSIFWFLGIFAFLVMNLVYFGIKETLSVTKRPPLRIKSTLQNYVKILCNKSSLGLMLASGFSFAGLFTFLTTGAFVYIDYYGVSTEHFGILFGLNIIWLIIMTGFNGRFVRKIGSERMLCIGLCIQLMAGVALIVCQVLDLGLWGTVIPVVLFVGTISIVGSNTMACILSNYPELAGTASSLAGTMRFGIGTIVGGIVSLLNASSAWPMASAMAICAVLSASFYWCLAHEMEK